MNVAVRWVLAAVLILKSATLAWAAGELPERVATHFGGSGQADGWMSRPAFVLGNLALTAVLVGGLPLLGGLLARGSGVGLNVPNRDYWLRPEHRDELHRRLVVDLSVVAAAVGLLLAWVDVAVVRANRAAEPVLGVSSLLVVGVFLVVLLGWAGWLVTRRYAVPEPVGRG